MSFSSLTITKEKSIANTFFGIKIGKLIFTSAENMYFSIPLFFLDAICVCFVPVKSTAVFSTYLLLLKKVDTHISRKQYIPTSYAMLTFRGGYFSNKIMSSVPNWNKQQHTFDGYKTLR